MANSFVRVLVLVMAWAIASGGPPGLAQPPQGVTIDAKALADFEARVQQFVDIHRKAEGTLPRLPQEATPQQIDTNQRELGRLIREARLTAKPGDIFSPDMQAYVRRLLTKLFATPEGAELRGSIMDENPQGIVVRVNDRYPDEVPFSTMPPQVLDGLPKMPEELQYRFVGSNLVILDSHAHIIADFIPKLLSGSYP